MNRKEELEDIFKNIDQNEKKLIEKLIEEVVYLEEQLENLKRYPLIKIDAQNPTRQKKTESAKLYKELSQSYMNAIRILCGVIHKVDNSAQEELIKRLSKFKL